MIKQIRITGLGPHTDFTAELDPRGVTTISGPSEVGKSFVLEAITFCLWGRSVSGKFPLEAIRDGDDKATVELTLDSGRVIKRSITRGKSQQRHISLAGDTQTFSSDKAFAQALGELTEDEEAVRVVVTPMAWHALVATNARKFRDLLMRLLPEGDVIGEVKRLALEAGYEVTDADASLEDKAVVKARGLAKKGRDQADGRVQASAQRIAAIEAALAEQGEVAGLPEVDEALLERIAAWEAYDRAAGNAEARKAAAAAQAGWDERRKGLGEEPTVAPEHEGAAALAQASQLRVQQTQQGMQEVYGRYQYVAMQMQKYASGLDPSVCPTCERGDWAQGAQAYTALQQQAQIVTDELSGAQTAFAEAQATMQRSNEAVQASHAAAAAVQSWKASIRALGTRPSLPDEADVADVAAPDSERPTPAEMAAAAQGGQARAAAEGARKQRSDDLAATREVLARDEAKHAELAAETERLAALLDAVRNAPSTVAARQALALGDLGPVSLEFGENPAVSVLIDGRPWWLASRGRQVVADGALRAALRRVMEMDHLPIVIDNVQDVGGQPLPDIDGPVILLRTDDTKTIKVRNK